MNIECPPLPPPCSYIISDGTLVEWIYHADVSQGGQLKINVHPQVRLLSDGLDFLYVIICCYLFHLLIFYCQKRRKQPRMFFVRHISLPFVWFLWRNIQKEPVPSKSKSFTKYFPSKWVCNPPPSEVGVEGIMWMLIEYFFVSALSFNNGI